MDRKVHCQLKQFNIIESEFLFFCAANCIYRRYGDMFNLNAIEHVFPPPPLFTDRGTLLSYDIFSVKLLNQSFSLQQQFNRSFTEKPVRTN